MIDHAEARAQRLFTADKMVEGTLAVYREVLTARSAPSIEMKKRHAA